LGVCPREDCKAFDNALIYFFDCCQFHELHEFWPHAAALDGFAVLKKAALQLSIRVIRVIRGQPQKRRKPFSPFNAINHIDF
jgi:hypothetical protein